MTDLSAFSLAGRTVMVTGANTGIGQGIALSIGRAGGRVIGVGRSSMAETAQLLGDMGAEFAEVRAEYPNELDRWLASPLVAPPGGESLQQVAIRVRRALRPRRG